MDLRTVARDPVAEKTAQTEKHVALSGPEELWAASVKAAIDARFKSVWDSRGAMLAYRNSGSHPRVMKISQALGARVDFRHWQADAIPSWEAARLRLIEQVDASAGAPANNGMQRTRK